MVYISAVFVTSTTFLKKFKERPKKSEIRGPVWLLSNVITNTESVCSLAFTEEELARLRIRREILARQFAPDCLAAAACGRVGGGRG